MLPSRATLAAMTFAATGVVAGSITLAAGGVVPAAGASAIGLLDTTTITTPEAQITVQNDPETMPNAAPDRDHPFESPTEHLGDHPGDHPGEKIDVDVNNNNFDLDDCPACGLG
jgi:hypothetical protein